MFSSSATIGRVYDSITKGSTGGSYVVPSGKIAIVEVEAVHSGSLTATATVSVGGYSYVYTSVDGLRGSATAFAIAGQTVNWSISGTSGKYRILVVNQITLP